MGIQCWSAYTVKGNSMLMDDRYGFWLHMPEIHDMAQLAGLLKSKFLGFRAEQKQICVFGTSPNLVNDE